jgi:hypothetical protein
VWTEKDAIAGVLFDVTGEFDVPLMVNRGFASLTFLHSAAETIEAQNKPAFIYYFGDWDPSGVAAGHNLENRLREFAPNSKITFERVAVNEEQIRWLGLPTRPTKRTDSRSKNFVGESVEVDAIAPDVLREIARDCIEPHVDEHRLHVLGVAEESERKTLYDIADQVAS